MFEISRRSLLRTGIVLTASSVLSRRVGQRAAGYQDTSVEAPREKLLFDIGWKFQFGHGSDPARDLGFGRAGRLCQDRDFEFSKAKFDDSKWRPLNLPHDWAVELPFVRDEELNSHGYKPLGRRYPETSVVGTGGSSRFRPPTWAPGQRGFRRGVSRCAGVCERMLHRAE